MTRFYPIYVRRSDGKLEVDVGKGREKNSPTQAQLDQTPNDKGICDYYRELKPDENKHMDWRRKLAGMLLNHIGGPQYADRAATSILHDLPENYRLYEHIKSRPNGQSNTSHKAKNHSGGGHDRQDAYLYGHPLGRRKRFRSPADFFPHLLWLVTDQTGDKDNCSCKLCCPEELEFEKAAFKEAKSPTPTIKQEPNATNPTVRHPIVEIISRSGPNPQSPSSKPSTPVTLPVANSPYRQPQALTPTPLPQPRSKEQQLDAQPNRFIYRNGEIVWFNRGVAWGLAVIIRRWLNGDQSGQASKGYMLQPLSYPLAHPPVVPILQEDFMRPFLAWSVPDVTTAYLLNNPQPYEMVDWQSLLLGKYGPHGDVEVDGSILAAKAVDASYTPFEVLKTTSNANGQEERRYNGIYLGAEKIWVGEAVRLRMGSGTDIMVVSDIIERSATNTTTGQPNRLAFFVGDIYTFSTIPVQNPSSPPDLPSNSALPLRLREDLRWRNNVTLHATRSLSYWKHITTSQIGISDIKGRWYESSMLMPILQDSETYQKSIQAGNIADIGTMMNNRGDGSGIPKLLGNRQPERMQALGAAVPSGTRITEGMEPPPVTQQQQTPQQPQQTSFPDPMIGVDDYLNLEGLGSGEAMDFSGGYGGHDGGHNFFD